MKKTQAQKTENKKPTPRGRHRNGKSWPYSGKNAPQRNYLGAAFADMTKLPYRTMQTNIGRP